jgi:hypothetical protein
MREKISQNINNAQMSCQHYIGPAMMAQTILQPQADRSLRNESIYTVCYRNTCAEQDL